VNVLWKLVIIATNNTPNDSIEQRVSGAQTQILVRLMPCNGFNHSPTCECGWGGVWYGNAPIRRIFNDGNTKIDEFGSPVEARSFIRPGTRRKPESLTIPNARCPVCGASVFFYQNEYGSRVFFDELGFDWPSIHARTTLDMIARQREKCLFQRSTGAKMARRRLVTVSDYSNSRRLS